MLPKGGHFEVLASNWATCWQLDTFSKRHRINLSAGHEPLPTGPLSSCWTSAYPSIAMMNSSVHDATEAERLRQVRPGFFDDFLYSLPFELLLQIVGYLDPSDILRSQRVRFFSHWFSKSSYHDSNRSQPRSPSDGARYSLMRQSLRVLCAKHLYSLVWRDRV